MKFHLDKKLVFFCVTGEKIGFLVYLLYNGEGIVMSKYLMYLLIYEYIFLLFVTI